MSSLDRLVRALSWMLRSEVRWCIFSSLRSLAKVVMWLAGRQEHLNGPTESQKAWCSYRQMLIHWIILQKGRTVSSTTSWSITFFGESCLHWPSLGASTWKMSTCPQHYPLPTLPEQLRDIGSLHESNGESNDDERSDFEISSSSE